MKKCLIFATIVLYAIAGRSATVTGTIVDATGSPVQTAIVFDNISAPQSDPPNTIIRKRVRMTNDADGTFSVSLSQGNYEVRIFDTSIVTMENRFDMYVPGGSGTFDITDLIDTVGDLYNATLTVTDGTTPITGITNLVVSGGTITSNTAHSATLTVTGGSGFPLSADANIGGFSLTNTLSLKATNGVSLVALASETHGASVAPTFATTVQIGQATNRSARYFGWAPSGGGTFFVDLGANSGRGQIGLKAQADAGNTADNWWAWEMQQYLNANRLGLHFFPGLSTKSIPPTANGTGHVTAFLVETNGNVMVGEYGIAETALQLKQDGVMTFDNRSTDAGLPSADKVALYAKGGRLYAQDDTGTVRDLTEAGTTGTSLDFGIDGGSTTVSLDFGLDL